MTVSSKKKGREEIERFHGSRYIEKHFWQEPDSNLEQLDYAISLCNYVKQSSRRWFWIFFFGFIIFEDMILLIGIKIKIIIIIKIVFMLQHKTEYAYMCLQNTIHLFFFLSPENELILSCQVYIKSNSKQWIWKLMFSWLTGVCCVDLLGQKSMAKTVLSPVFTLLLLSLWSDNSKVIQIVSWQQLDILKDQKLPC